MGIDEPSFRDESFRIIVLHFQDFRFLPINGMVKVDHYAVFKLKFNIDINVYFTAMKMPRIILSSVILLLLCCLMSCINLLVRVMRITHTLV